MSKYMIVLKTSAGCKFKMPSNFKIPGCRAKEIEVWDVDYL